MKQFKSIGYILFSGIIITFIVLITQTKKQEITYEVTIGILKHESALPIYIADELGYFKLNNLKVLLVELPPGDHMPALISNRVDIISATSFPVLFGIMSENPDLLYSVFPGAETKEGALLYGIISSKNYAGNNIYDLKKKIIMAINPFTRINIETILFSAGIPKEEWPKIQVASREVALSAVLNNTAQAAIMDQPSLAVALNSNNFKLLEANPRAKYICSPYWSGAGAVKRTVWKTKEEEFKKLMVAVDSSLTFIAKNPIEAHKILARKLGLDSTIANQMGGYYFPLSKNTVDINAINSTVLALTKAGLLKKAVSMIDFFPQSYYGQK